MSQGFGRTKRRIAEAKRQKREDKRRRQQVKRSSPAETQLPAYTPETQPAETGAESPEIS